MRTHAVVFALLVNCVVPVGTTIELTISQKQAIRLDSLRIVPDSVSLVAGDTIRMRARRFMSDGSSSDVAPTWTASAGAITSDGLYTAGSAPGRVTITASSAGVSGTAVVRVEQGQVVPSRPVPSQPPRSLPPRGTAPSAPTRPTKSAPTGQSPPASHVPWWLIAIGGAGALGLGWGVWRHFHEPIPPTRATTEPPERPQSSPSHPPLNFTYDYKAQEPKIELTAPQGHGSEISLVSYPGESAHAIEPASVKLFD